MTRSCLIELTDRIHRIEYCGMHVDLVRTSNGTVRIGSMPDIAKFLTEHGFREETVVVPDWEVSLAGDNRTGEEFILWQAQIRGGVLKEYVGQEFNINQVNSHLERIFPYFFDEKCLSIVRKKWLRNWFSPNIADPCYSHGDVQICCDNGNITIYEGGSTVYDRKQFDSYESPDDKIESLLTSIPRDGVHRDCLEVLPIGCGNGVSGTVANTIVRFGEYVIWIDPCGYPAHTLARHNIHWDDITHFLFTHNHEDHVQGFTACMYRARMTGRKLNLLVADNVFKVLIDLYTPLFPDLKDHINMLPLLPGNPLQLGSLQIDSRWNHHILPYGTLGLRISAGGRSFGYSGDTKYDETINRILKRKELTAEWFATCDLVFHEIEFDNAKSVHTHWKQVESLQQNISGKVLGYHTPFLENSPFPLAQEGVLYVLDGAWN
ncbi:MBL fold metallo-hydrolase [Maridesulfovibrio zosterae]|uniref:MBL fold metallo-hydrolase n=1 Tax=Maridesulfovibrio zosterae TaxID=82171 RepID=UPI000A0172A0|nr:MBL fold metallo-hydrolase [Maridesulfovibrio zosterae]